MVTELFNKVIDPPETFRMVLYFRDGDD